MACNEEEPRPALCSDFEGTTDLPDIPQVYSTEHLDIYVQDGLHICAGSAQDYESFYQYVMGELEIESTRRVPVILVGDLPDECSNPWGGCKTRDGVVFSQPRFTYHELAHAAACGWRFTSADALTEGLATSFEPDPRTDSEDPSTFITASNYKDVPYEAAAHFVRWLLEEWGPERFREAFTTAPLTGGDEVLEVLARVYGQDVDTLFADYLANGPHMWVPHRQCDDVPLLSPVAGAWEFEALFDCEDQSTLGPWERTRGEWPGQTMYQSFLIDVETAGNYRFVRDEVETSIVVERCLDQTSLDEEQADSLWLKEGLVPTLQGTTDQPLEPGTYRIDVIREYAPAHEVAIRIEPG
ncbi:MAG: hypothetical protein HC927_00535 [Deltaproteobacteria bacterium]|nr:hypothetical protein [Deltaproteobacteria bacterium]